METASQSAMMLHERTFVEYEKDIRKSMSLMTFGKYKAAINKMAQQLSDAIDQMIFDGIVCVKCDQDGSFETHSAMQLYTDPRIRS